MRQRLLSMALLTTLIATACTSVSYQSPRFADRASGHQTIAVLPFEMVFTGKAPAGLDAEQIGRIEEDESVAFQMALYDSLLNRSDVRWKRPIQIRVQPCEETRRRLDEGGILLGVQAEAAPSMERSMAAGSLVEVPSAVTIADGIAVKRPGDKPRDGSASYQGSDGKHRTSMSESKAEIGRAHV